MSGAQAYLALGTAIVSGAVVQPPTSAGYAPQPVSVTATSGGVLLNDVTCVFGPALAAWGTLTCFGVQDANGNPLYPPGTLQAPFTPLKGQLVTVPQGNITLAIGSQFSAGPVAQVSVVPAPQTGPTVTTTAALSATGYTQLLASGSRALLLMTNLDQYNLVKLVLGNTLPASGATPSAIIPPYGEWPPPNAGAYVPADAIWAIGTATGQQVGILTAGTFVPPIPPPIFGATVSGTVTLSPTGYVLVLAAAARNLLLLTNVDQMYSGRVILGPVQPASGAAGWSPIQPNDTWPPPSFGEFVPSDTVWVLGSNPSGQVLNWLTG